MSPGTLKSTSSQRFVSWVSLTAWTAASSPISCGAVHLERWSCAAVLKACGMGCGKYCWTVLAAGPAARKGVQGSAARRGWGGHDFPQGQGLRRPGHPRGQGMKVSIPAFPRIRS